MSELGTTATGHETDRDPVHKSLSPTRYKAEEGSPLLSGHLLDLTSKCSIEDFSIGTGRTIFTGSLLPAILSARREIVLATCFWAHGPTLKSLCVALKELSQQVIAEGTTHRIRVYICLSSRSLLQKLFHTSSKNGYTYSPSSWTKALGLPAAEELPGLHLTVKSLFFRPFSVLHPKYLIIDRREVWMPSCNVSWEEWYECCIHLRGQIVNQIHAFWQEVWFPQEDVEDLVEPATCPIQLLPENPIGSLHPLQQISFPGKPALPTALLPHPYNASLLFSLWFLPSRFVPTPVTPLNTTLLQLFGNAKHSIILLTPNFTSLPVYNSLLVALSRGVDVHIITNRRMMILEQLLTSGTVTEWWIWKLKRAYKKLLQHQTCQVTADVEAGRSRVGTLRIDYFRSPPTKRVHKGSTISTTGDAVAVAAAAAAAVKTHVKLTVIDEDIMVLGSGNMDRASWYTSQELGVMIEGGDVVKQVWMTVEAGLQGCLEQYI